VEIENEYASAIGLSGRGLGFGAPWAVILETLPTTVSCRLQSAAQPVAQALIMPIQMFELQIALWNRWALATHAPNDQRQGEYANE
jgi:hypothetical protein